MEGAALGTTREAQRFRTVREVPFDGLPAVTHPEWAAEFPWLVQGTTGRGDGARPFDLGLYSDASAPRDVLAAWERLRSGVAARRVVHAHQVHGAAVRFHGAGEPGLHLSGPCDGHACADPGTLLAVTTADCVPVSIVDANRRAIAAVHAGWRGAAAGVLERGVAVLAERIGSKPGELHVHLGPSICGRCYEVGPEVFEALGLEAPSAPTPIDLRTVLAERAVAAGVVVGRITISGHCTRCGEGFFSHRGGDRARQVGFLGVRT